jgi:PKD repeat protein
VKKLIALSTLALLFTTCRRNVVDSVVNVDFTYEVLDNDYSIPVRLIITNKTTGAQFYNWTFEGGTPATYDKFDPGYIQFDKPGPIKIKLEAWNDEERKEKEIVIQLDSVVDAAFNIEPVINNYGPTQFAINNQSAGVTKFQWTLENGQPATSTEKNPVVNYSTPGSYRVKLQVENDRGEKDTVSKMITVLPSLDKAEFDIIPSFDDDDYEAPLIAKLDNHTISATQHKWVASGGTLSKTTDSVPTITYTTAGNYSITYEATNGKQTKTVTRTITVKPNSGLRAMNNVRLGINTAHSGIGSFYSTRLRQVFKKDDVNAQNGPMIDLVFFGLSESFTYNRFISPDSAPSYTFGEVPGATHTRIINSQEKCGCGFDFTPAEFDIMTKGAVLQPFTIPSVSDGNVPFSSDILPRVILFQNALGKKGAIKIKQFVQAGQQSYIVCDIKVQKD